MVKAVVLRNAELRVEDIRLEQPGDGEVEVRHTAVLSTAVDLAYCLPSAKQQDDNGEAEPFRNLLGSIPGFSAAGVITELGSGVLSHHIGQRVAYCNFPRQELLSPHEGGAGPIYMPHASLVPLGSYCEARLVDVNNLVLLPDHVNEHDAAALLFPSFIVRNLLHQNGDLLPEALQSQAQTRPVVLVHPAGGFLGSLLCQWASHMGFHVVGSFLFQSDLDAGPNSCEQSLLYHDSPGFPNEIKSLLGGKSISIVYDLLGEHKVQGYFDSLGPSGLYVMLEGNLLEGMCWINKLDEVGNPRNVKRQLVQHANIFSELKDFARDLFALMSSRCLHCPPIKEFPLERTSQAVKEVHVSQRERATFCVLSPSPPNPETMGNAS